jgi:uncharacterized protein
MKLIVFGATGLLGSRIAAEAEARGHEVTRASRATGVDATDPGSVAAAAAGHDAALSAVTQHGRPQVLVDVARALLEGLDRAGVQRLVVAGGAGSLEVAPGVRLMDTPDFHEEWKPEAQAQADALDAYRAAETDVAWSYVSPGALLEPGERTGAYRTGGDELIADEQGRSRITMEDLAIAMLDEAQEQRHPRARFTAAH